MALRSIISLCGGSVRRLMNRPVPVIHSLVGTVEPSLYRSKRVDNCRFVSFTLRMINSHCVLYMFYCTKSVSVMHTPFMYCPHPPAQFSSAKAKAKAAVAAIAIVSIAVFRLLSNICAFPFAPAAFRERFSIAQRKTLRVVALLKNLFAAEIWEAFRRIDHEVRVSVVLYLSEVAVGQRRVDNMHFCRSVCLCGRWCFQ